MNCKIVEVGPSAPAQPRTSTAEELKNGTAPEGLYADHNGVEGVVAIGCGFSRSVLCRYGNAWERALDTVALNFGPFTHVGTVEVTLHLDRSKAVR